MDLFLLSFLILKFQLSLHLVQIHTAKLLVSLCSRKDSPKGPYLKKIKKSSDLEKQQLSVLCSLPGIGEKFAVRLLEKFGTPLNVFTGTSAELAKVEGLGEVRAKKIKKC